MTALSVAEVAGLLRASAAEIRIEVESLPEEVAGWHPAAGEWCVKECLGHLIEADRRGFSGRVALLLEQDGEPDLEAWDQIAVARARSDCRRGAAELLAEFAQLREEGLRLLSAVAEEDLGRAGQHPSVGRLSIGDVIAEWVHHDRAHLKQILGNVQLRVWEQMGASQLFSQPR